MQLAYKRAYGETAATYESCSTSAFKHGRTETIRPATAATNAACDLILGGTASNTEILNALTQCSAVHGELTKNAAMGKNGICTVVMTANWSGRRAKGRRAKGRRAKGRRAEGLNQMTKSYESVLVALYKPLLIPSTVLQCSSHRANHPNLRHYCMCLSGQGWDRHLYALRHFADDANMTIPLFTDPSYRFVNTITLSTSTLSSPAVDAGGFAPVIPHGLGVGE